MNKYNIEVGDKLGNDEVVRVTAYGIDISTISKGNPYYDWDYVNKKIDGEAQGINNFTSWKLTKGNNMNKYNLKVGDIIVHNVDHTEQEIELVSAKGAQFKGYGDYDKWDYVNNNYSPKVKGKIIGYTLLKDTPEAKAGTKLTYNPQTEEYLPNGDTNSDFMYLPKYVENNHEWFSPIYEEVKPTSVKVQTNAGEVTVTNSTLSLSGETSVGIAQALAAFKVIKDAKGTTRAGNLKVETFKVGCKTFHVNDIPKLEAAIKQVS